MLFFVYCFWLSLGQLCFGAFVRNVNWQSRRQKLKQTRCFEENGCMMSTKMLLFRRFDMYDFWTNTHTRTWEIWTHPVAASRASNRRAAGRDAQGMKVAAIYPTMPVTTTCSIMHYAQKKTNHEGLFYYCNQMSCFNHKNSLQVNMRCIMYILNINGQLIRQIDFT